MALNIIEKMEMPYDKLVTHTLPLNRIEDAIIAMSKKGYRLDGKDQVIKVAIDPWMAL